MHITDDDLMTLVEQTWAPSLGLAAVAGGPPPDEDVPHSGYVELTGAWHGRVAVDASDDFLKDLAVVMFAMPSAEVSDEDRLDALGEMANVLAGNVKPFADGDCEMSLPVKGEPTATAEPCPAVGINVNGHLARVRVVATT